MNNRIDISAIVVIIILGTLGFFEYASAHSSSAYYYANTNTGSAVANHQDWMKDLSDEKTIYEISIPGTHDSLAFYGLDPAQTQSMPLQAQLDSGIRALDIRVDLMAPNEGNFWEDLGHDFAEDLAFGYYNNLHTCESDEVDSCKFAIFHGLVYEFATLEEDVLPVVIDFLNDNPSETVIIKIKEENKNNSLFAQTMHDLLEQYVGTSIGSISNCPIENITLGAAGNQESCSARGKILVIAQNWDNFQENVTVHDFYAKGPRNDDFGQNEFELSGVNDLYWKWGLVKDGFEYYANVESPTSLYMNSLSAAVDITQTFDNVSWDDPTSYLEAIPAFPYFVASGHSSPYSNSPRLATGYTYPGWGSDTYHDFPRVDCALVTCTIAYEGINSLAMTYLYGDPLNEDTDYNPERYIDERSGHGQFEGRLGIVWMDFPGHGLIDAIINTNEGISLDDSPHDLPTSCHPCIENIIDDFETAYEWSEGAATDAYDWTGNAGSDALDWSEGAATDAYDWTEGAVNDAVDWAEGAANSVSCELWGGGCPAPTSITLKESTCTSSSKLGGTWTNGKKCTVVNPAQNYWADDLPLIIPAGKTLQLNKVGWLNMKTIDVKGSLVINSNTGNQGTIIVESGGTISINDGDRLSIRQARDWCTTFDEVKVTIKAAKSIGGALPENNCPALIVNHGIITIKGELRNGGTIENQHNIDLVGSGSLLHTSPEGTIHNDGQITFYGTISNRHLIVNDGRIVSNPGGIIDNKEDGFIDNKDLIEGGFTLKNHGLIKNSKTIIVKDTAKIFNHNSIINNKEFKVHGIIENSGGIKNQGTLDVRPGSTIDNTGVFDNAKSTKAKSTLKSTKQNKITINDKADAKGTKSVNLILRGDAIFENSGKFLNKNHMWITGDGTFSNKAGGTIENTNVIYSVGEISNLGAIKNNGDIYIRINTANDGTGKSGKLNNNGPIANYGTISIDSTSDVTNANVIDNHGTISNGGSLSNTGEIVLNVNSVLTGNDITGNAPYDMNSDVLELDEITDYQLFDTDDEAKQEAIMRDIQEAIKRDQQQSDPPSIDTDDDTIIDTDDDTIIDAPVEVNVPSWMKGPVGFWSDGLTSDAEFKDAIQFMINEGFIVVPETEVTETPTETAIPGWVKGLAGFWATDQTSDAEFVNGLTFLIEKGIIVVGR